MDALGYYYYNTTRGLGLKTPMSRSLAVGGAALALMYLSGMPGDQFSKEGMAPVPYYGDGTRDLMTAFRHPIVISLLLALIAYYTL